MCVWCAWQCDRQTLRWTGRYAGSLQTWLVKKRKVWMEYATQAHLHHLYIKCACVTYLIQTFLFFTSQICWLPAYLPVHLSVGLSHCQAHIIKVSSFRRWTDRQMSGQTQHLADGTVAESAQVQTGDCFPADAQTDSQQTWLTKKMMRWMMYAWMMF